jgi:hypothetical protein
VKALSGLFFPAYSSLEQAQQQGTKWNDGTKKMGLGTGLGITLEKPWGSLGEVTAVTIWVQIGAKDLKVGGRTDQTKKSLVYVNIVSNQLCE